MDPDEIINITRRDFLATTASGLGGLAFASLLQSQGLLAANSQSSFNSQASTLNPLAVRPPHFAPKAKQCIFLFMEGGTSQVDLFDPKPKLNEMNGKKLPDSFTKNIRFAFLQKDSAVLLGSPHKFKRYGKSGIEISARFPQIGSCIDEHSRRRSRISASSTTSSIDAAGVPSSRENGKKPAQSSRASSRNSSSCSWSSSVSPGNPTMNDDRNVALGSCARSPSMIPRNRSPFPQRFIFRSRGRDACWSDKSKYGTTVGSSSIVAIRGSRTSDG